MVKVILAEVQLIIFEVRNRDRLLKVIWLSTFLNFCEYLLFVFFCMYFVVTVFSNLFVYILSIGLQVQNKSICQSSFYVEREIRDKQSKSKTVIKSNQKV